MSAFSFNCSFGNIAFGRIQDDGPWVVEPDIAVNASITDHHYSDDRTIQFGGAQSVGGTYNILLDDADWAGFKAKLGTVDELDIHGSSGSAALLAIGGIRRKVGEWARCTATFSTQL